MRCESTILTTVIIILVIGGTGFVYATENIIQEVTSPSTASPSTTPLTSTTQLAPTTLKPKINIKESELCKKCSCDLDRLQLDCSNKTMTSFFSDDEWKTLQNGDIIFDVIKMNQNEISYIREIPTYPVKSLYLSSSKIFNISIGAFQNLKELTKLDLSSNQLTSKYLIPHVFKGTYSAEKYEPLPNLKSLNLADNDIHTLNSDIFEHLPNLEILILSKNTFHVLDAPTTIAISSLSSLKTLDLSHMELSELPETIFHGPKELQTLILTGNLFHVLPEALTLAAHLKKLVLDNNPLDDFDNKNVFKSLGELEYLSISYLPHITKIGPSALSNLQSLNTLVAADNPHLSEIHVSAFRKNTTNPDIFVYPSLKKLHLRNNNLTTVEHNWVDRWDKITDIDLSLNPWACDCKNSWFIHSLIKQINTTNSSLIHSITCATPLAWQNKTLLELSDNKSELLCENASHPTSTSLIFVGIIVGVLIGIPLTLGALVIYRKGCFGLLYRRNSVADRALYNRASFADEFHI